MSVQYVSYWNSSTSGAVKSGPTKLFGIISAATGGAVTVYDNTTASGTVVYSKTLAAGEVVQFGGVGIALKNGLYITIGAGTVTALYV